MKNNKAAIESFYNKAKMVRIDLESEIDRQKSFQDEKDNTRIIQLEGILNELDLMVTENDHIPSYPRVIVDSWDYNNKLGKHLLDVYELYKNKCWDEKH